MYVECKLVAGLYIEEFEDRSRDKMYAYVVIVFVDRMYRYGFF